MYMQNERCPKKHENHNFYIARTTAPPRRCKSQLKNLNRTQNFIKKPSDYSRVSYEDISLSNFREVVRGYY